MNLLRASTLTALAMSVTLASAQGASPSIEERLRQLEAEQAAMKQQLAERDAVIEELKRELQSQGAVAVQAPAPAAGATGAAPAGQAPVVATSATEPRVEQPESSHAPTPRSVETWGVYDPGTGFLVGRSTTTTRLSPTTLATSVRSTYAATSSRTGSWCS